MAFIWTVFHREPVSAWSLFLLLCAANPCMVWAIPVIKIRSPSCELGMESLGGRAWHASYGFKSIRGKLSKRLDSVQVNLLNLVDCSTTCPMLPAHLHFPSCFVILNEFCTCLAQTFVNFNGWGSIAQKWQVFF